MKISILALGLYLCISTPSALVLANSPDQPLPILKSLKLDLEARLTDKVKLKLRENLSEKATEKAYAIAIDKALTLTKSNSLNLALALLLVFVTLIVLYFYLPPAQFKRIAKALLKLIYTKFYKKK